MPSQKNVLVIGQCGVDGPRIQRYLESLDAGLNVVRCQSDAELPDDVVSGAALLLFNRELVGEFDAPGGIDLIRALHERYPNAKMMLVSDLPDAQRQACDAGALNGFGKSHLESDRTAKLLLDALA